MSRDGETNMTPEEIALWETHMKRGNPPKMGEHYCAACRSPHKRSENAQMQEIRREVAIFLMDRVKPARIASLLQLTESQLAALYEREKH